MRKKGHGSCHDRVAGGYSIRMTPITTNDALVQFCAAVANAPFIAVDTEFMRETTNWPKLCLIQAAWAHQQHMDGEPRYGLPAEVDPLEGWIITA